MVLVLLLGLRIQHSGVCGLTVGECIVAATVFFVQAEDGIRDLVRSRGLGDVYKRQIEENAPKPLTEMTLDEMDVLWNKAKKSEKK